jgi:hypothetical protein
MKKTIILFAFLMLSGSMLFAQHITINLDIITGRVQPSQNQVDLMKIEEANNPQVTKAIHDIEDAMNKLNQTPDNYGGNKGQAINDLKQAWASLRKALYYKIYQDEH